VTPVGANTSAADYLRASVGPRGRPGIVITCVCVCVSVCPSVHRITHERIDGYRPNLVGMSITLRGAGVERWSLTDELSLSCARPTADGRPLMWVNPLL